MVAMEKSIPPPTFYDDRRCYFNTKPFKSQLKAEAADKILPILTRISIGLRSEWGNQANVDAIADYEENGPKLRACKEAKERVEAVQKSIKDCVVNGHVKLSKDVETLGAEPLSEESQKVMQDKVQRFEKYRGSVVTALKKSPCKEEVKNLAEQIGVLQNEALFRGRLATLADQYKIMVEEKGAPGYGLHQWIENNRHKLLMDGLKGKGELKYKSDEEAVEKITSVHLPQCNAAVAVAYEEKTREQLQLDQDSIQFGSDLANLGAHVPVSPAGHIPALHKIEYVYLLWGSMVRYHHCAVKYAEEMGVCKMEKLEGLYERLWELLDSQPDFGNEEKEDLERRLKPFSTEQDAFEATIAKFIETNTKHHNEQLKKACTKVEEELAELEKWKGDLSDVSPLDAVKRSGEVLNAKLEDGSGAMDAMNGAKALLAKVRKTRLEAAKRWGEDLENAAKTSEQEAELLEARMNLVKGEAQILATLEQEGRMNPVAFRTAMSLACSVIENDHVDGLVHT